MKPARRTPGITNWSNPSSIGVRTISNVHWASRSWASSAALLRGGGPLRQAYDSLLALAFAPIVTPPGAHAPGAAGLASLCSSNRFRCGRNFTRDAHARLGGRVESARRFITSRFTASPITPSDLSRPTCRCGSLLRAGVEPSVVRVDDSVGRGDGRPRTYRVHGPLDRIRRHASLAFGITPNRYGRRSSLESPPVLRLFLKRYPLPRPLDALGESRHCSSRRTERYGGTGDTRSRRQSDYPPNSLSAIDGAEFAIDSACTPSCCLTCKEFNCALSVAMSASTKLPMPVVRAVDNCWTKVAWIENFDAPLRQAEQERSRRWSATFRPSRSS
jgi:hypothetical protein